jgi:hypothetical protein
MPKLFLSFMPLWLCGLGCSWGLRWLRQHAFYKCAVAQAVLNQVQRDWGGRSDSAEAPVAGSTYACASYLSGRSDPALLQLAQARNGKQHAPQGTCWDKHELIMRSMRRPAKTCNKEK